MNDHIAKPVTPDTLYAALLRWLPERTGEKAGVPIAVTTKLTSTTTDDLALQGRLAAIPGLNVSRGLGYADGQWVHYEHLLRHFLDNRDATLLREALAEDRPVVARRAAHTLKGITATLGALEVSAEAAAIEAMLRQPERPPADVLMQAAGRIANDISVLTAALRAALPDAAPDAPPSETAADPERLRGVLDELETLLAHYDMASLDLAHAHPSLLAAALGDQAHSLVAQIEDFAFEEALATLRAARAPGESVP